MDSDFLLALQVQQQWEAEQIPVHSDLDLNNSRYSASNKKPAKVSPEKRISVVDHKWELIDPIPDVRSLFLEFNTNFFWQKLSSVTVDWSQRMYSCAGVCDYEGRGGLCRIRLSAPLLKLRPRKDLVETLLHEMIHAYLFVTQNNKDHDAHGPEFHKHMFRLNKETGASITVYHTFYDEVNEYKKHWWRCSGPCRFQKPYFGFIKRTSNRAPSFRDFWWDKHKMTCGGTFVKVKEPENFGKKKAQIKGTNSKGVKHKKLNDSMDIRDFVSQCADKDQSQILKTEDKSTGNSSTSFDDIKHINNKFKGKSTFVNVSHTNNDTRGKLKPVRVVSNSSSTVTVTDIDKNKSTQQTNSEENGAKCAVSDLKFPGAGVRLGGNSSSAICTDYHASPTVKRRITPEFSPIQKQLKLDRFIENVSNDDNNKVPASPDGGAPDRAVKYNDSDNVIIVPDSPDVFPIISTQVFPIPHQNGTVECPVCHAVTDKSIINEHLDECLQRS